MQNPGKPKILVVDDEQPVLNALFRALRQEFDVLLSLSGPAALQILRGQEVMGVLVDQRMPEMTGVEFLQLALEIQPDAGRVLITGYSDNQAIIDAINKGQIFYYVPKPWEPEELRIIMRRAVERYRLVQANRRLLRELDLANQRLEQENLVLKQEVEKHYVFDNIIGDSAAMAGVFSLMKKIIPTDTTVLLQGETGTGKELVARAIHYNGPRQDKLFVAQNCAAMPDTLLESELFGHKKGAFTDAVADKKGIFELADGGTIFLDELIDTSPAMQQRLLRVLQEGEIHPLGSARTVKVDVRVISASNQDLKSAVAEGHFREDLYYRLNVFPIIIPPLRERRDDIPTLTHYFIKKFALKLNKKIPGISPAAMSQLMNGSFPGNIRELENILERAVVLADDNKPLGKEHLQVEEMSEKFVPDFQLSFDEPGSLKESTAMLEKNAIIQVLTKNSGNISRSAKDLSLSRLGLYKKIDRLGIDAKKYKHS